MVLEVATEELPVSGSAGGHHMFPPQVRPQVSMGVGGQVATRRARGAGLAADAAGGVVETDGAAGRRGTAAVDALVEGRREAETGDEAPDLAEQEGLEAV